MSTTLLPSSVAGTDVVTVPPPATVVGISPSSTAATNTMLAVPLPGSSSGVTAPAVPVTPPVVVVRQLQAGPPYNGSTSWKLFRDFFYFNRVTKVNSWITNEDLVQHLTL